LVKTKKTRCVLVKI